MKNSVDVNHSQRLFIELGTSLHLESNQAERIIYSEFIGMKVGSYLIVRLSETNWEKSGLKKGDPLRVKYICSDDVFGFNTRVATMIQTPDRLVFLNYPHEVESCNIRTHHRIECFLPVEADFGDGVTREAVVVNINKNGSLCRVKEEPPDEVHQNNAIVLKFIYSDFDTLSVNGRIKSIRRQNGFLNLGIMFSELDAYSQKVLTTLVPALEM